MQQLVEQLQQAVVTQQLSDVPLVQAQRIVTQMIEAAVQPSAVVSLSEAPYQPRPASPVNNDQQHGGQLDQHTRIAQLQQRMQDSLERIRRLQEQQEQQQQHYNHGRGG
jgi:hypothetical protein